MGDYPPCKFLFRWVRRGVLPNRRNITTLWLFKNSSTPFSRWRPGRFLRFVTYAKLCDVFPHKKVHYWGWDDRWHHSGGICLQNPQKWAWINNAKPKRRKIKIAMSPKKNVPSSWNMRSKLIPTIVVSPLLLKSNLKMATGWQKKRHDVITQLCVVWFGLNLVRQRKHVMAVKINRS